MHLTRIVQNQKGRLKKLLGGLTASALALSAFAGVPFTAAPKAEAAQPADIPVFRQVPLTVHRPATAFRAVFLM